jgi:hypothetical protein
MPNFIVKSTKKHYIQGNQIFILNKGMNSNLRKLLSPIAVIQFSNQEDRNSLIWPTVWKANSGIIPLWFYELHFAYT